MQTFYVICLTRCRKHATLAIRMKRDALREFMEIAVEAYDLSATTPPLSYYSDVVDEENSVYSPRMKSGNRHTLLDFSIDVKRIYDSLISDINKQYGQKRVDRFVTWLKVGFIEQFHSEHRCQIKEDRKRLRELINSYKNDYRHSVA